jgi:hypothetical protein
VEEAGILELLAPGDVLFLVNSLEQLLECLGVLFSLGIGDDLNHAGVLFADFHGGGLSVENLDTEDLVTSFVFLKFTRDNLNSDLLLGLVMAKVKNTFLVYVVFSGDSDASSGFRNLDGLEVARDLAIASLGTVHFDNALLFSGNVLHVCLSALAEGKESGLVIIQNQNNAAGVLEGERFLSCDIVELNGEFLIGFPLLVIDNLDLNFGPFVVFKANCLVDRSEIFLGLGSISEANGADTDLAGSLLLVMHFNLDEGGTFRHSEVEAVETEVLVLVLRGQVLAMV